MSVFNKTQLACPACGAAVTFELVHSVNAVRRPDLRAAILDRDFQRQPCPSCGTTFRVAPQFTYLDIKRKQFFAVWPASNLEQWQEFEARSQAACDRAFGPGSDGAALAGNLLGRCVFGWLALNEKLIALEHGIDDVDLEVAKVAALRTLDNVKLGADREFRLVGATDDELMIGWLRTDTEEIEDQYRVPRQLLQDIQAEPDKWVALRAAVSGGMFVDYRRMLFGQP